MKRLATVFYPLVHDHAACEGPNTNKASQYRPKRTFPVQFLAENSSLTSSIVLASFGSNAGYNSRAFTLTPSSDSSTPPPAAEQPLRYGKLPEIHHVFRANAKSPPVVISIVFLGAVVATLPVLAGVVRRLLSLHSLSVTPLRLTVSSQALYLSANVSALPAALRTSPVSHISFLASISGIEFVFFLYYTTLEPVPDPPSPWSARRLRLSERKSGAE